MQDLLTAGGLRLYREGVEPSGSLRKVSGYIHPPFQDFACRKVNPAEKGGGHENEIGETSLPGSHDCGSRSQGPGRHHCRGPAGDYGVSGPRRLQPGRTDQCELLFQSAGRYHGGYRRQSAAMAPSRHLRAQPGARHRLCAARRHRLSDHLGRRGY